MRYLYSTIRYVPNQARGEFINIGVVTVADNPSFKKSAIRVVRYWHRASHLSGATTAELEINMRQAIASIEIPHTVEGLQQLHRQHHGVIQFSPPLPVIADSAEHAINCLWSTLTLESIPEKE